MFSGSGDKTLSITICRSDILKNCLDKLKSKELTLSHWAELGPAGNRTFLRVLTNYRLHEKEWQATQYGKATIGQQENSCNREKIFEIRNIVWKILLYFSCMEKEVVQN